MRIVILSRNKNLYSTQRLVKAGEEHRHEVHVVDTLKCYMDIATLRPAIYYKGERLEEFDAVIPRIGASITPYGLAVLRQFEMLGVFPLNESIAIGRARDKFRAFQLLAKKGIGLPVTGFAHDVESTQHLIKLVGGPPLVVKLLSGTQGKGVVLAETNKAAESVIDAFREVHADFLVQEFIKEAAGSDIRCFVIGGKVVAAMQRQAKEGEFRSNIHRGGRGSIVKLTPEERAVAIRATRAIGLRVAGVDLLRSTRGPLVMEVNASPGLQGIEKTTGKNVAGMMIGYIEKNARNGGGGNRGFGRS